MCVYIGMLYAYLFVCVRACMYVKRLYDEKKKNSHGRLARFSRRVYIAAKMLRVSARRAYNIWKTKLTATIAPRRFDGVCVCACVHVCVWVCGCLCMCVVVGKSVHACMCVYV